MGETSLHIVVKWLQWSHTELLANLTYATSPYSQSCAQLWRVILASTSHENKLNINLLRGYSGTNSICTALVLKGFVLFITLVLRLSLQLISPVLFKLRHRHLVITLILKTTKNVHLLISFSVGSLLCKNPPPV